MATILVIEDQTALCRLYRSILDRAGYRVTVAQTGEEGVIAAAEIDPDLVVMDMALPGMSGVEVARRLAERGRLPATPIIITTAYADAAAHRAIAAVGPTKLLIKPFGMKEMLEAVGSFLSNT